MLKRWNEQDESQSWGNYMEAKKAKLISQFNENSDKFSNKVNDLFKGIAIFVNGYTVPSAEELRCLMIKHGGSYHNYYKSGSTTHIIASNLPDSKLKLTKNHKIIKPEWITDSIKANKVLNHVNYLLHSNQSNKQFSLRNMFPILNNESNRKDKNATEEGFLSDFYNNSRLHHISMMGAIFKDYINGIRNNKNHKLSGRDELHQNSVNKNINLLASKDKKIMHIDMDCFFVSVGLRNHPELKGLPVAVTHSNGNRMKEKAGVSVKKEFSVYRKKLEDQNQKVYQDNKNHWSNIMGDFDSFAEIASCSYEARKAGIKNGMFVGQALKLCPDLKFIHYDFDAYKEVSFILYNTVLRYTIDVEAVSCDEMYADCTELLDKIFMEPMEFSKILRNEIKEKTGCPCSIGFGKNRLLARLATKRAKPDGQFYLKDDVTAFMYTLPVSDLPGVGGSTYSKLKSLGIRTCGELQAISLSRLQEELGKKVGENLHKNSFGKDDKPLTYVHSRKSVSADINYGIRFSNDTERDNFLQQLSNEVSARLTSIKMKGRSLTLKIMVRDKDAPEETAKYLGHGVCDHVSKGVTLLTATSSPSIIYSQVLKIIRSLNINCKDLRGLGIQITRLEPESLPESKALIQFLESNKYTLKNDPVSSLLTSPKRSILPSKDAYAASLQEIDQSFLNAMPDDIRKEITANLGGNIKELKRTEIGLHIDENSDDILSEPRRAESMETNNEMKTYISPKELRLLIKQWVETEETPHVRDTVMIAQYLRHLVGADHLEDLVTIIKYFFRYIVRRRDTMSWKKAYLDVITDTQTYIKEKYNSNLVIECGFDIG